MAQGKSIRIHLKDGTVSSLKTAEIGNRTILALSCPRNRISELNDDSDTKKPGVYLLFGDSLETLEPLVYIGEAENVASRIQAHVNKEYWNEVVIFVSKDNNLTKSHVKYLESKLVTLAKITNRYKIDNTNLPQQSSLPSADRDDMEDFISSIKLLLGIFGHKVFENLINPNAKPEKNILNPNQFIEQKPQNNFNAQLELFYGANGINAKSLSTDEGFVVLKDSHAFLDPKPSLQPALRDLRRKLINENILKADNGKYIFQKDYLFKSPSQASGIVSGSSTNGRIFWKDRNGKTLKEIEEQITL